MKNLHCNVEDQIYNNCAPFTSVLHPKTNIAFYVMAPSPVKFSLQQPAAPSNMPPPLAAAPNKNPGCAPVYNRHTFSNAPTTNYMVPKGMGSNLTGARVGYLLLRAQSWDPFRTTKVT